MQQNSGWSAGIAHARLVVVAAAAVVASGCTIMSGMGNQIDRGEVAVSGVEVIEVTPAVVLKEVLQQTVKERDEEAIAIRSSSATESYRLGAGDVVRVVVWEHPELNNPSGQAQGDAASSGRLIEPDGTMFFPYVGKIQAAGLTPAELREKIAVPLSKIIREPQVDVRVTDFRSQRVYVTGEVMTPGPMFLNDSPVGALDAIAIKGGFTELSNRNQILLTRDGVTSILGNGDASRPDSRTTLPLKAGDVVFVPDISDDKIFLLGEFANQKTLIQGRSSISLAEALTQGGGLDKLGANAKAIFVFRRNSIDSKALAVSESEIPAPAEYPLKILPRVYALDMTKAESLLLAERFPLKPRDVVYIASTDFSKYNRVVNQLLPTISTIFQLDRLVNSR